ncbi:sulfotransferase family 2 domain-containing protein [Isoptericola sp. b515]|uniref:sulfotransferase family 2 domain-containing protein n=1 Tax=Isoptericola sp. b515 TaxID=3064652 RepID=UPI0027135F63|nr:sulfotransferase family 2 domain-containing protein [Isoptericola sp. b515]MDO8147996.1 sulfotransferase family 2 domain-containing protein [Isoptericola sp. b515]
MPVFTKDGRNVLFVHVPKTGGSAVEKHFLADGWKMTYHDGRMGKDKPNYLRTCTPQHMHGDLLRQTFRIGRFDAVFAVVRDPLMRFRSEYVMRHKQELSTSAEAVEAWAEQSFRRYARNPFVHDNHIRPQVQFLVDEAQVYRLEDGLDAALEDLNRRHDLGVPTEVARVRTSEKTRGISSKDVEVSDGLEERLRQFYADDFARFGYGEQGLEAPAAGQSMASRVADRASRGFARLAERL